MGFGPPLVDGLKRTYAARSVPFGRLIHGRTVTERDETFSLLAAAAAHLAELRQVRALPV